MLRVLALFVVACLSCNAYADELIKDYLINAQVYTYYGELDASQQWREKYPNAKVDLQEYAQENSKGRSPSQPQAHWQAGAHHILDISPLPENTPLLTQVRITVEFYPQANNDEPVQGYYLQQLLSFEHHNHSSSPSLNSSLNLSLSKVETEFIEQDDFGSRFIASSDTNLIRGLLYRWTQGLDEPDTDNLSLWLSPEAKLALAEKEITSIVGYQAYLAGLGLTQSRRAIKNLQIQAVSEEGVISVEQEGIEGRDYRVEFEYQWSALNGEGETEMANIGVVIHLHIQQGKVRINRYQEQYLPPKTDLGAEIRC
jgi:hypothetical protein